MEYHTIILLSQYIALALFIGLFIGVLIYAFSPRNKKLFDHAANIPLDGDLDETINGKK